MRVVVLAEKPAVARDIAKVLGATRQRVGYLEHPNGELVVTYAVGHLLEIAAPQVMDDAWRRWSLETLPMLPEQFTLVERDQRAYDQLVVIQKLFCSPQTNQIVCATDAGREGELIFRYIYQAVGAAAPVMRLWISSLTAAEILRGFNALKRGAEYDELAAAARARSEADWLVGMNLTRLYRLVTGCEFTVGRVQTPTLAMIVARDSAIAAHIPEVYYEVQARFACADAEVAATYVRQRYDDKGAPVWLARLSPPKEGEGPLGPEDDAQQVAARARSGAAHIKAVQPQTKSMRPPPLFDLTSLQRSANVLWGWSAARTLAVAQELYEREKALTYPRTDSRHLTVAVADTLGPVVDLIRPHYEDLLVEETGQARLDRRFVDDAQVSDHHAIIPTGTPLSAEARGTDAGRLYDLVCRRLLAAWQPDYQEAVTEVTFEVRQDEQVDRYLARGKEVIVLGWRKLEPAPKKEQPELPSGLRAGLPTTVAGVAVQTKKTRAPDHFTDATVLSAMESAGDGLGGEASQAMRDRGLGTPATRADILEKLLARGYLVRDGKSLRATPFGEQLVLKVHPSVRDARLTGDWEARLRRIERGEDSYASFMADVREMVTGVVEEVAPAGEAPRKPRPQPQSPKRGRSASKRDGAARTKRTVRA